MFIMEIVEICEADPSFDAGVLCQNGKEFSPNHLAKGVQHCVEVSLLVFRGEGLTKKCFSEHAAALSLLEFDGLLSLGPADLHDLSLRM